ncbi:glutamate-rich protein 6B isoform X4 [Chrysemys picta bellii]|uniref:glutamate-rich protein 6B isoform X4 n=1 Tax=Chrysemys picta bellii TaxID=8478 RepID=UPI0032B23FB8
MASELKIDQERDWLVRRDMSKGHKLSGAGSNQPQPRTSPSPSGCISSDSQSGILRLTVENVKKLEEEYLTAKGVLGNQSVEEYVKQSNLCLLERERSGEVSGEHVPDKKDPEGAVSFLPRELDKKSRETHLEKAEEISHTGSLLAGVVVLFTNVSEEIETQESEEGSEENNQTKSKDEVVRAESDAAGGEDRKSDDEAPGPDSEEAIRDDLKITTLFLDEENHLAEVPENCEFCKAVAKPIPTVEDLDTEPLETLLCCRTYKEVFECVIKELMESTSFDEEIDIAPHPHLSQTVLESETRKKLEQQLQERGFDKYRELYERYIKFGALTKISFKFSQPQEEVPVVGPVLPQTLEDLGTEFRAEHLKNCHARDPVRRYYPDGQKFFLLFPDGTGQVFYPSGNIAILIVYVKEVQFIYVILEDHTYSGIRAFFTNRGYATCYHRNGLIWLNLDRLTGSYFDKKGRRQKHWSWQDFSHHVHAPPFQSICMKLNIYIRIKIVAQEQIYLSFTKQQNCIYFNMGTRLKLKDTATLHLLKPTESQLGLLLHSKSIQINNLLAKMKKVLRDLQRTPLNKIQGLPLVLAQLRKLLKWRRRKILAQ